MERIQGGEVVETGVMARKRTQSGRVPLDRIKIIGGRFRQWLHHVGMMITSVE